MWLISINDIDDNRSAKLRLTAVHTWAGLKVVPSSSASLSLSPEEGPEDVVGIKIWRKNAQIENLINISLNNILDKFDKIDISSNYAMKAQNSELMYMKCYFRDSRIHLTLKK